MKLIFALALLIAGTLPGLATPFLVSDPYTPQTDQSLNPSSFIVTGLTAQPVNSPAYTVPSTGAIMLAYDLSALSNGNYSNVTAQAVNVFGEASLASAPFSFRLGAPVPPSNLNISTSLPQ